MDLFKVEGKIYSRSGALTNRSEIYYYSSADQAEVKYHELSVAYYTQEDGTTGMRMYQPHLYIQSYKEVSDVTEFFNQFK